MNIASNAKIAKESKLERQKRHGILKRS